MKIRLDKLLAANGLGSRKDIRRLLRKEAYCINELRVTDPSVLVDPDHDTVSCNGELLILRTHCYLMLHKPKGVVTSTDDPIHATVMDLLPPPFSAMKLFPIGRLDIDTEGLLIITNDGQLTHRITAPKSQCIKTYYFETATPVDKDTFKRWAAICSEGVQLANGFTCLPATLEPATEHQETTSSAFLLHICEGKYHQVKKMVRALGNEVVYLKRIAMAGIRLDPNLPCGSCRELTQEEKEIILNA